MTWDGEGRFKKSNGGEGGLGLSKGREVVWLYWVWEDMDEVTAWAGGVWVETGRTLRDRTA